MFDNGRRALWRVGVIRAGGGGWNAGQVDVVLDRERHAVQRQILEVTALQRGQIRLKFSRAEQVNEQVIGGVERSGLFPQGQNQLARR
ncbi:hypothetical protein A259_25000 [Pseudomonas syringae pv. actinidiae ICMP 19070]|nr:hypothetical protein A259_25000 [Pseudomonas syringae pv. actinidiae ICMP 19070]